MVCVLNCSSKLKNQTIRNNHQDWGRTFLGVLVGLGYRTAKGRVGGLGQHSAGVGVFQRHCRYCLRYQWARRDKPIALLARDCLAGGHNKRYAIWHLILQWRCRPRGLARYTRPNHYRLPKRVCPWEQKYRYPYVLSIFPKDMPRTTADSSRCEWLGLRV